MHKQLPIKLTKYIPCRESTVELRFNNDIPTETIAGFVWNELNDYTPPKSLPVMQLPKDIRERDPNLKFAPYFVMEKGNIQINFSSRVFAIINKGPYIGWSVYYKEIDSIIKRLSKISLFKTISRIAVRYINFFEKKDNILNTENLNIAVETPFQSDSRNISYSTIISTDEYINLLKIQLDCNIIMQNIKYNGTLIDVDTFQEYDHEKLENMQILDRITNAHNIEKKIFFNLLKKDFINDKLGGEYE